MSAALSTKPAADVPPHLLSALALVAKDEMPGCPAELVSAGLAYWHVTPTARTLRPTLEGRVLLEHRAQMDATRETFLEIGALQHKLAEAERERDEQKQRADRAEAWARLWEARHDEREAKSPWAFQRARARVSEAVAALRALGVEP